MLHGCLCGRHGVATVVFVVDIERVRCGQWGIEPVPNRIQRVCLAEVAENGTDLLAILERHLLCRIVGALTFEEVVAFE